MYDDSFSRNFNLCVKHFFNKENILIIGNLFSDIIPGHDMNIDSVLIEGSFGFDTSHNHPCDKISKLAQIYKFI